MARGRRRASIVAVASAALVAASLWSAPGAGASEQPTPDASSIQTSDPAPTVEPSTEPAPSPTPSPDLSPSPEPAPSPSLSPGPDPSETAEPETPSESADPSTSPSEIPSPSPTESPSLELETVGDPADRVPRIVVVKNGAYTDSIRSLAAEIGGDVEKTLVGAVDGFVANLNDEQVALLSEEVGVDYIEYDLMMRTATSNFRSVTKTTTVDMGNIDDGSSSPYNLGFTVNWFEVEYDQIIMNNNGGAVLNDGLGAFSSYTGIDLDTTSRPLILPLFTDLDSTGTGTGSLTYGQGTVPDDSGLVPDDDADPDKVFWAEWTNVGEFPSSAGKYTFQMLLIDGGNGRVTVEFNYDVVGVANSTFNKTFEVGFADPNGINDLTIAANNENPATVSTRLTGSKSEDSDRNGRWRYLVDSGGAPTPAPTPSPTDGIQTGAPWGLDRIDQRALPLSGTYSAPDNGAGVTAYIVDTGILTSHTEFSGRTASGYTSISDGRGTADCHGHGTHVASSVAGTTYGVAKGATVVPIRVLSCSGSGTTSGVVAGLNWIRDNHNMSTPAVVNMSLGGGGSKSLDDAVAALHDAGIPVVVAAGNSNADAQFYSPAREPKAITVGATSSNDARASFSNYGSILDIFAPGQGIIGAWYTSNSASATISGTSMASPHVAGGVAVYLGLNPNASSSDVATAITSTATTSVVSSPGSGSPNRLLYVGDFTSGDGLGDPEPDPTPTPAPPSSGGGFSGGGGSSGGGGLNAVSTIVPAASGAPGSQIALAGWGLETARDVQFNDVSAQFTVVDGSQVDVVVPDIPPGVYVIHVVLAPTVGRASFWDGFSVLPRSGSAPTPVAGGAPVVGKEPQSIAGTVPAAEFVAFKGNQTKMTRATRSKLAELARDFVKSDDEAVIVAYTNAKGTKKSLRRAEKRANNMRRYLIRSGFRGDVTIRTEPGDTKAQRRGAMIYAQPAGSAPKESTEGVTSVIVRMKKGRAPTVDGQVRGAENVPEGLADSLSIGRSLGLRMYRIDFAQPVSEQVAEQVAADLMEDPGVAFAEPDSLVSTQVSSAS